VNAWTEPDDAVLLELGRLTWAAINLEDIIPEVRRAIGPVPAPLIRAPAAEWVKDALRVLAGWPKSEIQQTADRWFRTALAALEERNNILHSVPVTMVAISNDGTVTTHGQALQHMPRRGRGSYRRIRLAENDLRLVRQKLVDAREGWVELCLTIHQEKN
jgi:hypothetical protein